MLLRTAVVLLLALVVAARKSSKPNMVWFLTDDQDQMLGGSFPAHNGATPMPQTQALMSDAGATATNFFIHTPICCPSRGELLTGRYFHNIKQVSSETWAMHVDEELVSNTTFGRVLKEEAGYTVGMFGKYLNVMPKNVPPGFDAWLANGGGNYVAPQFDTKGISDLAPWHIADGGWHGTSGNYSTAVIGNVSTAWIRKVVSEDPSRPFFAYIAPKAAHEPFNPAPWYRSHWNDSWPQHEPRPPAWNSSAETRANHNGAVAQNSMLSEESAKVITEIFKNRWRTLMSVDDVIAAVINLCEELSVASNTFFFYSSDHGFQLGEFNIPMDKRHVYDWDTRIHLLARGPGIKPGSLFTQPSTQVDMAPTFLSIAGLAKSPVMDGKSLLPLLLDLDQSFSASSDSSTDADADAGMGKSRAERELGTESSTMVHVRELTEGDHKAYAANWRDHVFIEYYFVNVNTKCMGSCPPVAPTGGYPNHDSNCGDLTPGTNDDCWANGDPPKPGACNTDCYATESTANNWIALRHMPGSKFGNNLYAEYQNGSQYEADVSFDRPDFIEWFDAAADPWMLKNKYDNHNKTAEDYRSFSGAPNASTVDELHELLHRWFKCAGDACP